MTRYLFLAGSIALLGISTGCPPKAALHTEVESSAIRTAEEVGANEVPIAALHLQLAKEELAEATAMHERGDKEEAESMLMRAEADAELAVVLSRQDAERTEAAAAVERVRVLRSENK
jgi:hypothetical protein